MVALVALLLAAIDPEIRLEVQHQGALVLGTIDEVPVTIFAPEDVRPLRVSTNVGSFGEVTHAGPGAWKTSFRLPSTKHPQVALVAVWRETGPNAPITFLRIPLSGKTRLPVGTQLGAEVIVLVGEETFGPIEADRRGRAAVPIVVPPGVRDVLVRSTSGTTESQKRVPVDLPPYNRLTLAVTPHVIEADGRSSCTAHVFYDSDRPPLLEDVLVSAKGGAVSRISGEKGRYRFSYVPERGVSDAEVELSAKVARDRTSKASTILSLGSPVPQQLVIKSGGPVPADGRSQVVLQLLLMDKLGLGVAGRTLTATAASGTIGPLSDLGEGRYALPFRAPAAYPQGGRTAISVAVVDRREVSAAIELPIAAPPWPASATVSIDPALPISDGRPFVVDVIATDHAGDPFEGGVVLTASSAAVSPLQNLGEGRYRAEVLPPEGAESIELVVKHPSGNFSHLHRTVLRPPPAMLTLGAEIGGAYQGDLVPTGALEITFRIPIGERRFALFLSVGFRQVRQSLDSDPSLFPAEATSRYRLVPISAGVTYDVLVGESWRAYAGVAGTLVPFQHHVEVDLFDTPTEYAVGGGGEAIAGVEWFGVFIEVTGGYAHLAAGDLLRGPGALAILSAGYRLQLF